MLKVIEDFLKWCLTKVKKLKGKEYNPTILIERKLLKSSPQYNYGDLSQNREYCFYESKSYIWRDVIKRVLPESQEWIPYTIKNSVYHWKVIIPEKYIKKHKRNLRKL